ncbi:MAG: YggS family pyridoxal phosphate-dependent enzyme [Taibaiella sp.]|nr:YggS family pyridoxal phosphate-dependent enzyme [Taibaiella sp.]
MVNEPVWKQLREEFDASGITLVAVSKTKPIEDITALHSLGQLDFGENYVQELIEKQAALPADIKWHFIGHLQSNKVKYIAPFVHLIHAVDSFRLLLEIEKQAAKNNRTIDVLLQLHVAEEETKFGMDEKEMIDCLDHYEAQAASMTHVRICGVMGMATNTEDEGKVLHDFQRIYAVFKNLSQSYFLGKKYFSICSIGMSGDYPQAIAAGGNMVRIGSLLFGERQYH